MLYDGIYGKRQRWDVGTYCTSYTTCSKYPSFSRERLGAHTWQHTYTHIVKAKLWPQETFHDLSVSMGIITILHLLNRYLCMFTRLT